MLPAERLHEFSQKPESDGLGIEYQSLVDRIVANRDTAAFEVLFNHFGPRIKAMMIKSGMNSAEAEDLVQTVMLTVWHKISLYSPERGTVATWIFAIARNARIDKLRKRVSQPYLDVEALEIADENIGAEESIFVRQRADCVNAAIASLSDDQRQVITLSFADGLTQADIADRLSLPLGTVKSRMRLAYVKLRTSLENLE
jgi:RNA polymerase sigma-70 factor, ECF subfamily